jgi:ectoine hydroxylase-related dioxygenase (phytanoyl-CoA dioxygenase family)
MHITSISSLSLSSNGLLIPFTEQYFRPLEDCTFLLNNRSALIEFYQNHHYLYLKNFLSRESVLDIRDRYFRKFDPILFKEGTTPREGIFSGHLPANLPRYGTRSHPAYEMVRDSEFHGFTTQPKLFELAQWLLGKPAKQLRRRPLRHFIKNTLTASRAHADAIYLESREQSFITCWIPLGDCPLDAGGLIYLEGSHQENLEHIRGLIGQQSDRNWDARPLTRDLKLLAEKTGRRWLWSHFQAGDLVVHSPYIIHASVDSSADLMRVSTDIRFVPQDGPIDCRWSNDWSADDTY